MEVLEALGLIGVGGGILDAVERRVEEEQDVEVLEERVLHAEDVVVALAATEDVEPVALD